MTLKRCKKEGCNKPVKAPENEYCSHECFVKDGVDLCACSECKERRG